MFRKAMIPLLALALFACAVPTVEAGPIRRGARLVGRVATAPFRFVKNRCCSSERAAGCSDGSCR